MTTEERMALDAEVHRKVFGRECRPLKWGRLCGFRAGKLILDMPQRDLETQMSIPAYSADIAEAWLVVEAVKARGWFFTLADVTELPEWHACFHSPDRKNADGANPSAPVAICRAALEAVKQSEG